MKMRFDFICFSCLGLALLTIGIRERFSHPRSTEDRSLDFFEPRSSLHSYPALHRVKGCAVASFLL
jgi:hypothetical protein